MARSSLVVTCPHDRTCKSLSSSKMAVTLLQSLSVRDMSSQVKAMRSRIEQDENVKVLMAGFRGSNLDNSDFAMDSVKMQIVEIARSSDVDDQLPLIYNPDLIATFWSRRPVAVMTRVLQLLRELQKDSECCASCHIAYNIVRSFGEIQTYVLLTIPFTQGFGEGFCRRPSVGCTLPGVEFKS